APSRPFVTPRLTTSPIAGPPVVSRAWNTRGSVGRVPTAPCCPTPETNPVSVVDRGRGGGGGGGGGATATGGGATGRATTRRAAAAGGRRTRGGRARAAPGAGGAASTRRAQAASARNSAVSAPSDTRSARSRAVGMKLRQLRFTSAASSADLMVPTVSKRTRSVLRSGWVDGLCPGAGRAA